MNLQVYPLYLLYVDFDIVNIKYGQNKKFVRFWQKVNDVMLETFIKCPINRTRVILFVQFVFHPTFLSSGP